jgi:hypothetical protein
MRLGSTTSLLNQKEQVSSGNMPILHSPKKVKIFSAGMIIATLFWDSKDVLHLDFLAGKKTINAEYYSNLLNESEAENTLKVKKVAGFSLLPPRQCSSSHCRFNDDNSTETEVVCTASSSVQSRLSSV